MLKNTTVRERSREGVVGVWYAIAAFTTWGVLPLYWKALKPIPSSQIIAHRILWSCIFIIILLFIQKRLQELKNSFSSWRYRFHSIFATLCLGVNWFIYIWAVNTGHVVDASFGYFINPLLNVLLGVIFLRERLRFWQIVSVILAFSGVMYMAVQYGKLPWIALSLAFTFGFYGLLRKTSHSGPLIGLSIETIILSPMALSYLIVQQIQGTGAFASVSLLIHILMISAGILTVTPLLLFVDATRRIRLSTVGFIQYLTPSIQLLLGVIVFKEPFTNVHLTSFSLIWIALFIYSLAEATSWGQNAPSGKGK